MTKTLSKIEKLIAELGPNGVEFKELGELVNILDKFDALVNDISIGLPAELSARRPQYEHYRNKLLTFKSNHIL
jgi:type I restriction enzyme S subunit